MKHVISRISTHLFEVFLPLGSAEDLDALVDHVQPPLLVFLDFLGDILTVHLLLLEQLTLLQVQGSLRELLLLWEGWCKCD